MTLIALSFLFLVQDTIITLKDDNEIEHKGLIQDLADREVKIVKYINDLRVEEPMDVGKDNIIRIDFDPMNFKGALRDALKSFYEGQYQEAGQKFLRFFEEKPKDQLESKVAMFYTAESFSTFKMTEALEHYKKYTAKFPNDFFSLISGYRICIIYTTLNNTKGAKDAFKAFKTVVDQMKSKYWETRSEFLDAQITQMDGNLDGAAKKYRKFTSSSDPELKALSFINLLQIYRKNKDWANVKDCINLAKSMDADDTKSINAHNRKLKETTAVCLGEYQFSMGNHKEALLYFLRSLLLYNNGKSEEYERTLAHLVLCIEKHIQTVTDKDTVTFYKAKAEDFAGLLKKLFPGSQFSKDIENSMKIIRK
ncbi:MAG: hypothetical protein HY606_08260 [Planctomycetes bacterium]|nr:hypothetical protein [Planctomycetota bacterium]